MPRPTTKIELINSAQSQWDKIWKLIDTMSENQRISEFNFKDNQKLKEAHWTRDKNLRDVIVHLYEWHQLLLNWTTANLNGEPQPFLPKPYNWKTYCDMNVEFWKKHQSTSYENAKLMLNESHKKVRLFIESMTNEELFEKKHFSWTGTTTLGSYCISVTASHYDWAIKKLKLHNKICPK